MMPRRPLLVPIVRQLAVEERSLGLAILGSTGSIGRQTLEVVDLHPERFHIVALCAGGNAPLLKKQIAKYQPRFVVVGSESDTVGECDASIGYGVDGMIAASSHDEVDIVVIATSGHSAILPTARAIEAGKVIALANKESIVCAGELISTLAVAHSAQIRPVDSEHSAIWQALGRSDGKDIRRLILTASGGPFRETPEDQLASVTVSQAMAHPTWVMGNKVTIDSATLMNKGLELIEAHWLFGVDYDHIDVVVHPESIVHSLVEFDDGSQLAQLSHPDMRLPIQYALTFPEHRQTQFDKLSLPDVGMLRFFEPDLVRFPALRLAREAGIAGQTFPTVLSAADEVAVSAFADGHIGFRDLAMVVEETLALHEPWPLSGFDALEAADEWGHRMSRERVDAIRGRR